MRTGLVINYALSQKVEKTFTYYYINAIKSGKLSHIIPLAPFKAVLPSNALFQRINSNSILRFLGLPSSVALGELGRYALPDQALLIESASL
jgi:hypothetical protein